MMGPMPRLTDVAPDADPELAGLFERATARDPAARFQTAGALSAAMAPIRELHYRIGGAATGLLPGAHRSRSGNAGFEFCGHAALHDAPDARRLDLHASLRDPFGAWIVRRSSERRSWS